MLSVQLVRRACCAIWASWATGASSLCVWRAPQAPRRPPSLHWPEWLKGRRTFARSAKAKVLQLPDSPEEVECEVTEEALAVKQYGTSAEQLDRHAC